MAGDGGECGWGGLTSVLAVKAAEGVPGVLLAALKTRSFSERFVGTSPFLHHLFCSHHVGISWQAKALLQNV